MDGIKIGRISSIDYGSGTADVVFEDEDNQIIPAASFLSGEYLMPSVGDKVLVLFQTGGKNGCIVGRPFHSGNLPEKQGRGVYFKRFSPTAYIWYDPDEDVLTLAAGRVALVERKDVD